MRKSTPANATALKIAAATLFDALARADQRLMLRQLWRLVPRSTRTAARLTVARPFAPPALSGLRSSTGGAR